MLYAKPFKYMLSSGGLIEYSPTIIAIPTFTLPILATPGYFAFNGFRRSVVQPLQQVFFLIRLAQV